MTDVPREEPEIPNESGFSLNEDNIQLLKPVPVSDVR